MARVIWPASASEQLDQIIAYIEVFDPAAARRIGERLRGAAESLAQFPDRGRPVAGGKRELASVPPYVVRYRVAADQVYILGIRHGARRPLA